MKLIGIKINGIDVLIEHGHYLLHKDSIKMRCDFNELNRYIPEFEEYLADLKQKKLKVG